MYSISFTLKQHTPLIHFQHNQDGATLRATEVKPKLDRYLDILVFESNFSSIKKYLTGYSIRNEEKIKKAYNSGIIGLDYKVTINAGKNDIKISDIPEKFPCFFGNMGDDNVQNPKKFSFCDSKLKISFKSDHAELIGHILAEFPNFLARNNFGNRQSKGFGSFYIDSSDPNYIDPTGYLLSYFTVNSRDNNFDLLFKDIDVLHKILRSGINDIRRGGICHFYMKPLIWQYFRERNIGWDKKAIKQRFYSTELAAQLRAHEDGIEEHNDSSEWPISYHGARKYHLVKDLLGLSSLEKWRIPYNVSITKSSNKIDRFKSPIFYKPIKLDKSYKVFIDAEIIPDDFHDSEFTISNGRNSFVLTTPTVEEFDITDFLIWCFSEVDIENCISPEYRNVDFSEKILKMFSQLQSKLNI
jgi:hypothetical protein